MDLQGLIIFVPVLLLSVIAHEYAHGYAALRQGDQTALMLGRLTWNPIKHIDPMMTIIVPAVLWVATHGRMVLGGAKPVPVDPRNYKHLRRGDIIVSLAGVATNLAIGLVCVAMVPLLGIIGRAIPSLDVSAGILQAMMVLGVTLNFILVAFNLIPIPPLDGSHVMKYLLPASLAWRYQQFGRYGIVLLVAVMWIDPRLLEYWLSPALGGADRLLGLVDGSMLHSSAQWLK